jgi:hypothetical protein
MNRICCRAVSRSAVSEWASAFDNKKEFLYGLLRILNAAETESR